MYKVFRFGESLSAHRFLLLFDGPFFCLLQTVTIKNDYLLDWYGKRSVYYSITKKEKKEIYE